MKKGELAVYDDIFNKNNKLNGCLVVALDDSCGGLFDTCEIFVKGMRDSINVIHLKPLDKYKFGE